jgi:hypothetical protein
VIYAEPWGDLDISQLFTGIAEMSEFVDGLHISGRIVRRAAAGEAMAWARCRSRSTSSISISLGPRSWQRGDEGAGGLESLTPVRWLVCIMDQLAAHLRDVQHFNL